MPDSPMTDWERVAEDMLRRIRADEWPGDTRLPSEEDLAKHYSVSRIPVRQALQDLTARGVLVSGRGRGRRVRRYDQRLEWWPAKFEHAQHRRDTDPNTTTDAWMADIEAQGIQAEQEVEPLMVKATPFLAEQLRVAPDDPVLCRARTRTIRGVRWQLADSFYPMWIVEGEGSILLRPEDTTVPGGFMKYLGHEQAWFDDFITCRMPTLEESRRLKLEAGTPVIEHARTGYDSNDIPTRVLITIAPGDRHIIRYRPEAR